MRITTFFLVLLLVGLTCLQSCKKDNVESEPRFKKGDVLFIGIASDTGGLYTGAYWQNNVMTRLSNNPYEFAGDALVAGLAVLGNDIIAVGHVSNAFWETTAVYWKNGQVTTLAGLGSSANAIFISGTDVYIAGTVNNKAVYWKNGVLYTLGIPSKNSIAESVFVSGNDVYVSGSAEDGALGYPISKAVYWKNNVLVQLTGTAGATSSQATGISVVGTDVYNCGYISDFQGLLPIATIWKNGIPSFLETTYSRMSAITIYGTDTYAAGISTAHNGATYWKNGAFVAIGPSNVNSTARCIAVSGSDVYIGGQGGQNGQTASIWKNGVETKLSDGGVITGIYIVP